MLNTMKAFRSFLLIVVGSLLITSNASANTVDRWTWTYSGPSMELTDLCAFPVEVWVVATEQKVTDFYDRQGNWLKELMHGWQQDEFRANGKVLHGVPYNFACQVVPNGDDVQFKCEGVLEKVQLPDGGLFIGAGQMRAGVGIVPDVGTAHNIEGLCAALAP
jgi:hypothetical protein